MQALSNTLIQARKKNKSNKFSISIFCLCFATLTSIFYLIIFEYDKETLERNIKLYNNTFLIPSLIRDTSNHYSSRINYLCRSFKHFIFPFKLRKCCFNKQFWKIDFSDVFTYDYGNWNVKRSDKNRYAYYMKENDEDTLDMERRIANGKWYACILSFCICIFLVLNCANNNWKMEKATKSKNKKKTSLN